jgi:hypothetical protein
MSASGVVSIAFANTGFVLLSTIPSKMFPPGGNDLVEMLKDYLANLAPQTRRAVVFKILRDVEEVRINPNTCIQHLASPHARALAHCPRSNRNGTAIPVHRESSASVRSSSIESPVPLVNPAFRSIR